MGLFISSPIALVACVVGGGLLLGILNTVFTESVMNATDLPPRVASSAYSSVRFLGGAAAPPLATTLAALVGPAIPYYVGSVFVVVAALTIAFGRKALHRIDGSPAAELLEAEAIGLGDAT